MILTDKAKEDFKEWVFENYYFQDLNVLYPLHLVDTLIIEWFDSIGLWEQEFYEVYIESTPTTEFKQIIERTITNLNKKYNERFK